MSIRIATKQDLISFCILGREFSSEAALPYPTSDAKVAGIFEMYVDNPEALIILMEDDVSGQVVGGFVGTLHSPMFSEVVVAAELFWYVGKSHRGQKDSTAMLKLFEEWGASKGAVEFVASDIQGLLKLEKMYNRLGYTMSEITYTKENT